MGVVWEAEQWFPVRREVALKIVRQGVGAAELIERFDAERRSLARMSHDGIVRVYEAGETESGHPYFVMELVEGTPFTEHCDRWDLPLPERLRLFLEILQAVQHAHQKGVLHRDLKPSNILVAGNGEEGAAPKLIDFGIAKVFAEGNPDLTLMTMPGQILGTPQYMSPEQSQGGEIDTRTDVYGLGAILYELISGSPPIPREKITGANAEEILKLVREFEPERPSVRMESHWSNGATIVGAISEGGGKRRWQRDLREELDWIALRCLEKDPERRYESVGALADDVRRYLEGNAVQARPPSRLYRVKKFVRRNRLLVSSLSAVAVVLAVATALSVRWAVAADEARQLAEKRLAQTDAVPDFLFNAFRQADRSRGGAEMLALDVLREAEKEVEGEFADQPVIRARIQESIGMTYRGLGRDDLAAGVFGASLESYRSVPGNEEAAQRVAVPAASSLRGSGEAETAIVLSEREWRERESAFGNDHQRTHEARLDHCRSLLEAAYWNDDRRTDYLGRVEAILSEVLAAPDLFPNAGIRDYEAVLAQFAAGSGNHAAALAFWDPEVDRIHQEGRAGSEAYVWPSRFHIAALHRNRRPFEAMAASEVLVLYSREHYGLSHGDTATVTRSLALIYASVGTPGAGYLICHALTAPDPGGEVDPLFGETLEKLAIWAADLAVDPEERSRLDRLVFDLQSGKSPTRDVIEAAAAGRSEILFWLAEFCWAADHRDDALDLGEEAHRNTLATHGAEHPLVIARGNRLAWMLLHSDRLASADAILSPQLETLADPETKLTWRHGGTLDLTMELAGRYSAAGDDDTAGRIARKVTAIRLEKGRADIGFMERYYEILRKPVLPKKDSALMVKLYEEVVPAFAAALGHDHWATSQRKMRLADALIGCGRPHESLAMIKAFDAENGEWKHEEVHWRITEGRALTVLKRYDEALAALNEAWEMCLELGFGGPEPAPLANPAAKRTAEFYVFLYTRMGLESEKAKWERVRKGMR